MFGVDYATVTPSAAKVAADGAQFVCRYLSGFSKDLTPEEAKALQAVGLHIVTVWETTGNRALDGYTAGHADAVRALTLGARCGMPVGSPIYFAVDFDATPAQQVAINAYFAGVKDVLGHNQVGAYGSYYVVKRLFDAGLIAYGWQTYAWSGGQWEPRAQLQQYKNSQILGGLSVDFNRAVKPDFGQWRVKVAPVPPFTPDPHPEPKNSTPFVKPLWPVPVPTWFWAWAQWKQDGESYQRPWNAPKLIPAWAWLRLKAL